MVMVSMMMVRVVMVMVMPGVYARHADMQIASRKCASFDTSHLQFVLDAQTRKIRLKFLLRKPQVKKSRGEHIPRDPGKKIQMKNLLRRLPGHFRVG